MVADENPAAADRRLTAIDTSLRHALSPLGRDCARVSVSLDELKREIRLWRAADGGVTENPHESLGQDIDPLVIGAVDRVEAVSIGLCREILACHLDDAVRAHEVATRLDARSPSRRRPIRRGEAREIGLPANPMSEAVYSLLLELDRLCGEIGHRAAADFDEIRAHGHEILTIVEGARVQVYFQDDKDWFYRTEERRWITMSDQSGGRCLDRWKGRTRT